MRTKPRNYFNCTATDKLILFDYLTHMDQQIDDELEILDNEKRFKKNDDPTFADEFLDDAEKLFRERGCLDKRTLTLIESLRGKVKTFDSWRVIMETLLLATMAYSSGDIPEIAQSGVTYIKKVVGGGSDGGSKSGKVRKEKAEPIKEAWQAEANKIWMNPKYSKWSNSRVAKKIVTLEQFKDENINTIRRSIEKTLP